MNLHPTRARAADLAAGAAAASTPAARNALRPTDQDPRIAELVQSLTETHQRACAVLGELTGTEIRPETLQTAPLLASVVSLRSSMNELREQQLDSGSAQLALRTVEKGIGQFSKLVEAAIAAPRIARLGLAREMEHQIYSDDLRNALRTLATSPSALPLAHAIEGSLVHALTRIDRWARGESAAHPGAIEVTIGGKARSLAPIDFGLNLPNDALEAFSFLMAESQAPAAGGETPPHIQTSVSTLVQAASGDARESVIEALQYLLLNAPCAEWIMHADFGELRDERLADTAKMIAFWPKPLDSDDLAWPRNSDHPCTAGLRGSAATLLAKLAPDRYLDLLLTQSVEQQTKRSDTYFLREHASELARTGLLPKLRTADEFLAVLTIFSNVALSPYILRGSTIPPGEAHSLSVLMIAGFTEGILAAAPPNVSRAEAIKCYLEAFPELPARWSSWMPRSWERAIVDLVPKIFPGLKIEKFAAQGYAHITLCELLEELGKCGSRQDGDWLKDHATQRKFRELPTFSRGTAQESALSDPSSLVSVMDRTLNQLRAKAA